MRAAIQRTWPLRPEQRQIPYRHSGLASSFSNLNVLFVGAERANEFDAALRLLRCGHNIFAVNPRETVAAINFQQAGGTFLRGRIEELSRECCGFNLILENYPYPSGRHYVRPPAFALARLVRLAPRGKWILYTESSRFAALLKTAVERGPFLTNRFRVRVAKIPLGAAPPSDYPQMDTRYRLIFERRR
jgi:hypothetical protein